MENSNQYTSVARAVLGITLKEKNSRFIGYVFPIENEDDVNPIIKKLRKLHPAAHHICYAWQLGIDTIRYRIQDDGEPRNSAGQPIYGQIQSCGLTNVIVLVVRIFGGTKLGVGGLISAYKTTAKLTLEAADLITKPVCKLYELSFDYPAMGRILNILDNSQSNILSRDLTQHCKLQVAIPLANLETVLSQFGNIRNLRYKSMD